VCVYVCVCVYHNACVCVCVCVEKEEETEEKKRTTKMILDAQYKCFEKMNRDPPYNKTGRPAAVHNVRQLTHGRRFRMGLSTN